MRRTTFRIHSFNTLAALSVSLVLTACGGGGGGSRVDEVLNQGSSSSATSSASSSVNTVQVRDLGRGSGSSFVPGEIEVGVTGTLSPGGTTTLTVNVVSGSRNLVTESLDVTFNSRCVAAQEAILSASTVTTTNGEATVTYTANGCVGEDDITATASYNETVLTATGTVNVEADTVGSVQFVDATPSLISLKGTGGNEVSVVRFMVRGASNAPMKNVCVEFSLNTSAGGLQLNDNKCEEADPAGSKRAKTNAAGYASISVQSGTVATPVTITATDLNSGLSTQSSGLRVSTGVPDQKSMSLSASVKNPSGWNYDGKIVTFTVLLADAFSNPPADGTVVSFTTSGGAIQESCTTTNGACTVEWRSQNPRPSGGRVAVLAHTTGNESFIDVNGNGWYDLDTDIFAAAESQLVPASCELNAPASSASGSTNACDDLPEAYLDGNFNGSRDNVERFIDFDQSGDHNALGDSLYNGVLCRPQDETDGKCSRKGVTIRDEYMLVMSSENPHLVNDRLEGQPQTLPLAANEQDSFKVLLADINMNPLPAGTIINVNTSQAKDVNVTPTSFTIPSTVSAQELTITVKGSSETNVPSGYIYFVISVPDGLETITESTRFN